MPTDFQQRMNQMFVSAHDESLPTQVTFTTIRSMALTVALCGIVVAFYSVEGLASIGLCSVVAWIVCLCFAFWCARETAHTAHMRRRKFVWFTLSSSAFVTCLYAIFELHQNDVDRERSGEMLGMTPFVVMAPTLLICFLLAATLAWCLMYLMAAVESPGTD